jgi:hypothetical protein
MSSSVSTSNGRRVVSVESDHGLCVRFPETIGSSGRRSRTRRSLLGIERTQSADINSEFVGKIEGVLRDHGVIVFATPTAGVRFDSDAAA